MSDDKNKHVEISADQHAHLFRKTQDEKDILQILRDAGVSISPRDTAESLLREIKEGLNQQSHSGAPMPPKMLKLMVDLGLRTGVADGSISQLFNEDMAKPIARPPVGKAVPKESALPRPPGTKK